MKKIFLTLLYTIIAFSLTAQKKYLKMCIVGDNWGGIIDNKTNNLISRSNSRLVDQNGVIIIPVVVHVVYKNLDENISEARINTLINRMNTDCRKLNPDVNLTPSAWAGLTADMGFEFRLACIDPQGNPTNGIVRQETPNINFHGIGNYIYVKRTDLGGSDAWPTDTYLNIWICDSENEGWAMFPWQYSITEVQHPVTSLPIPNSLLDGVVLSYWGVDNPNYPSRNKSRVVIHEIGH